MFVKVRSIRYSEMAFVLIVLVFTLLTGRVRAWDPFELLFPESLRFDFEKDGCLSMQDAGQRGLCELLSATSRQIQLLQIPGQEHNFSSTIPQSSCKYQDEGGASLHRYATKPSPGLQLLLEKYTEMHRLCVRSEYTHLGEHLHGPRSLTRCRYVVWSCTFGLGNRLMSLVSAFLYALLSQRVLLVDNPGWEKLFCQPFEGSNWLFPRKVSVPRSFGDSFSNYYDEMKGTKANPRVVPVSFTSTTKVSEHRFMVCPSALRSVVEVPFLNFQNSNQYYAPGFFLNPVLRPVLEELFPERRIFHNLGRFLLNPSDPVWERVSRAHDSISNATMKFGVQIRDFAGRYTSYYDTTVPLCLRSKLVVCPIELEELRSNLTSSVNESTMSVYIATMIKGHVTNIQSSLRSMETDVPGVRFFTRSQEADGEQKDDPDHQQKALVDIWSLSLSDVLITSAMSTFGYTAQALAGVTPFRITHWPRDPCLVAVSSDPCFHFAPARGFECRDDNFTVGTDQSWGLNYAWQCRDMMGSGMQLSEP